MTVTPEQRFRKRTQDCPICGGNQDDPHHKGIRCKGYLSDDGTVAFCSREEYGGPLTPNRNGDYAHRLDDPCRCGRQHGAVPVKRATPSARAKKSAPKKPTTTRWRSGPFPASYNKRGTYSAAWHYRDAEGRWRFSVVRYDEPDGGKAYPQARWREDGSAWAWGLGDEVTPILYQLPDLVRAKRERPVLSARGRSAPTRCVRLGWWRRARRWGPASGGMLMDAMRRCAGILWSFCRITTRPARSTPPTWPQTWRV